uniref:Uncharacterized protein n=1 Tax=Oryza nivara TaxID=4536 RepID=A0A0E0GGK9_ORYNI
MWNAVLTAHTQPGDVEAVARLFHSMAELELGFELIELNGLKSGCSRLEFWLEEMQFNCKVKPHLEHYTGVVGVMA